MNVSLILKILAEMSVEEKTAMIAEIRQRIAAEARDADGPAPTKTPSDHDR